MEGRFFNDYIKDPKLSQTSLLSKLENQGFEIDGKRILTIKKGNIPITFLLLLCNESKQNILKEIQSLKNLSYSHEDITNDELENKFGIQLKNDQKFADTRWEHTSEINVIDTNIPLASGTNVIQQIDTFRPTNQVSINNQNDIILPESFEFRNEKIITKENTNFIPLANLYKNVISFFEFQYAIDQRVRFEINKFNEYTKKAIKADTVPSAFQSNIMRRKEIIHQGNFYIDYQVDKFVISKKPLEDQVTKGFNEAVDWINSIYCNMTDAI